MSLKEWLKRTFDPPSVAGLCSAVENGDNIELVRMLEGGIKPDSKCEWRGREEYPLVKAVRLGRLESVRLLLAHGADTNVRAPSGERPLHTACRAGNVEILKLLLNAGADVESYVQGTGTPLAVAVDEGEHACLAVLLEHGVDINAKCRSRPNAPGRESSLLRSLKCGSFNIARTLMRHGAALDESYFREGLELACDSLFWPRDVVEMLVAAGAFFPPGESALGPISVRFEKLSRGDAIGAVLQLLGMPKAADNQADALLNRPGGVVVTSSALEAARNRVMLTFAEANDPNTYYVHMEGNWVSALTRYESNG